MLHCECGCVITTYHQGCIYCLRPNVYYKRRDNMDMREMTADEIRFNEITRNMFETYKAKNADYGNSFEKSIDQFGLVASAVRMSDKLNRFSNLITKDVHEVEDESLQDTLLDLANYCIMTAIIIDKSTTIK